MSLLGNITFVNPKVCSNDIEVILVSFSKCNILS